MTTTGLDLRAQSLLSVQRALLGEVSARLRAVVIDYSDVAMHVFAFFDGELRDEDAESMSCVEAEVMADFPSTYAVDVKCIRCDAPQPILAKGVWAYKRRE